MAANSAKTILDFWFEETKPYQWFRRSKAFDQSVRDRFASDHQAACAGRLDAWRADPHQALALIIVLDQFSRNIYRDNSQAFSQDDRAVRNAEDAIGRAFDLGVESKQRAFFYMPFMHSEKLSIQERSVELFKTRMPGTDNIRHALEHCDVIKRFGRFPHRNKILGRQSTPAETAFLIDGGFNP